MTVILYTITFILFAITCVLAVYLDAKIQKHIFVQHPKLWKPFGYSSDFHWFVPSATEKIEYAIACFQLSSFLKSSKCKALGDVELLRLKELNKLIQKIVIFTAFCMVILGCIKL